METVGDVFYEMNGLSLDRRAELLRDAHAACESWHADLLDCGISFARVQQDVTFDEIASRLTDRCHFVVIRRRAFIDPEHGEVGFSTMSTPDWLLFITVSVDRLDEIVNKFELKPRV